MEGASDCLPPPLLERLLERCETAGQQVFLWLWLLLLLLLLFLRRRQPLLGCCAELGAQIHADLVQHLQAGQGRARQGGAAEQSSRLGAGENQRGKARRHPTKPALLLPFCPTALSVVRFLAGWQSCPVLSCPACCAAAALMLVLVLCGAVLCCVPCCTMCRAVLSSKPCPAMPCHAMCPACLRHDVCRLPLQVRVPAQGPLQRVIHHLPSHLHLRILTSAETQGGTKGEGQKDRGDDEGTVPESNSHPATHEAGGL